MNQDYVAYEPLGTLHCCRVTSAEKRGFTMLEVMFAIMILGVGLIAVASLFPFAGKIQKDTFEEMEVAQVEENVKALVFARGFHVDDADAIRIASRFPFPMRSGNSQTVGTRIKWSVQDMSFPSHRSLYKGNSTTEFNRRYFWEPVVSIRRSRETGDVAERNLYVFITKQVSGKRPTIGTVASGRTNLPIGGEWMLNNKAGLRDQQAGSGGVGGDDDDQDNSDIIRVGVDGQSGLTGWVRSVPIDSQVTSVRIIPFGSGVFRK